MYSQSCLLICQKDPPIIEQHQARLLAFENHLSVVAKLCDFGFSGSQLSNDATRGGSIDWGAPECWSKDSDVRRQAASSNVQDFYSFALVCVAILTGGGTDRAGEAIPALAERASKDEEWKWLGGFLGVLKGALVVEPSERKLNLTQVRSTIFEDDKESIATRVLPPPPFVPFRRDLSQPISILSLLHTYKPNLKLTQSPQNSTGPRIKCHRLRSSKRRLYPPNL
jgi:serine/threonine protein kinase